MGQCYSNRNHHPRRRMMSCDDTVQQKSTFRHRNHHHHTMIIPSSSLSSPTSIIIPEITEHTNGIDHSFSSSDDDNDIIMSSSNNNIPTSKHGDMIQLQLQNMEDQHPMVLPEQVTRTTTSTKARPSKQCMTANTTNATMNSYNVLPNTSTTSLITVQRERIRPVHHHYHRSGWNPTTTDDVISTTTNNNNTTTTEQRSTNSLLEKRQQQNEKKNEDIVNDSSSEDDHGYSNGGGSSSSSPTMLRRLMVQTKHRWKPTNRFIPSVNNNNNTATTTAAATTTTASFSHVHESLKKSIIFEEDDDDDYDRNEITDNKKVRTVIHRMDTSMATACVPSDEETDDIIMNHHDNEEEPDPALPSLSRSSHRRRQRKFLRLTHTNNNNNTKTTTTTNTRRITTTTPIIGPLSPIKLQTSHCVSPHSIRVYNNNTTTFQENDIPATIPKHHSYVIAAKQNPSIITTTTATVDDDIGPNNNNNIVIPLTASTITTNTTNSVITNEQDQSTTTTAVVVDTTNNDDDAIASQTIHNFNKLQLQIQVASRKVQKEKYIHKVTDRIHDVQQHRQLWDIYQHIQHDLISSSTTSSNNNNNNDDDNNNDDNKHDFTTVVQQQQDTHITTSDKNTLVSNNQNCHPSSTNVISLHTESIKNPSSNNKEIIPTSYDTITTNPIIRPLRRRTKPRRFLRHRNNTNNNNNNKTTKETTIPEKIVVVEVVPSPTNTSIIEYDMEEDIPKIIKKPKGSPQKSRHVKTRSSSPSMTVPVVNDAISNTDGVADSTTTITCTEQPRVRSNSFDLKQTETWFFDFQEEFPTTNHDTTTFIHPSSPMDHQNNNMSSNNSQANLSLLSANSLDVQRRLYAEKRRQRKKGTGTNQTSIVPGTPTGLPNFRLTDETPLVRNGRGSGHRSVSSYDYGPSSKVRSSLISDVQTTPHLGGASAQDLYNAPTEAEKLRIAKDILRRRNVTNMEVTFITPKMARRNHSTNDNGENSEIDNSSVISDLDESYTSHHTNRSHHSASNHYYDYGPPRRTVRRSMRHHIDGDGEDQSSLVSEMSFDKSHKMEHPVQNVDDEVGNSRNSRNQDDGTTKANNAKYDFQSVVQRRLDIEERLRALTSSDDPELSQPSSSFNIGTAKMNIVKQVKVAVTNGTGDNSTSHSALTTDADRVETKHHVKIGTNTWDDNGTQALVSLPCNMSDRTHIVTPSDKDHTTTTTSALDDLQSMYQSLDVMPNEGRTNVSYEASKTFRRSDFSRLLDAVEVTRTTEIQSSTSPSFAERLSLVHTDKSIAFNSATEACDEGSHGNLTNDMSCDQDNGQPFVTASLATSLSVINESYESSESPNSHHTTKFPMHYLQERTSNELSVTPTNEILRLAYEVEANVNDILHRYRQNDCNDDAPMIRISPPQTSPSSDVHESHLHQLTELHLIEDSPP